MPKPDRPPSYVTIPPEKLNIVSSNPAAVSAESSESDPNEKRHYKGVRKKRRSKFGAQIGDPNRKGGTIWLGSFDTAIEAAKAYDRAAFNLRGSKAVLNFPLEAGGKSDSQKFESSEGSFPRKRRRKEFEKWQYRGVSRRRDKFSAEICDCTRRIWLGTFATAIEAAKAYDRAAFNLRGNEAILNFPLEDGKSDSLQSEASEERQELEGEVEERLESNVVVKTEEVKEEETVAITTAKENIIKGYDKEFCEKEKALDSYKSLIQDCTESLEAKEKKRDALDKSVRYYAAKLKSKLEALVLIEEKIAARSSELHSRDIELDSLQKSILECSNELESKQQHLEAIQKYLEQLPYNLESKEKQLLDLVEKVCSEGRKKADAKEKHLVSLERSVDERLEKFETEKRLFDARVKEFELREKQFVSVQQAVEERSKELDLKEKQLENTLHSQVRRDNSSSLFSQVDGTTNTGTVNPIAPSEIKIEWPEHFMFGNANETSSTDIGVGAIMDGRSLQGIADEHLDEPELKQNEVLDALQNSPDPAKFVLDLMLGTSSQYQNKGGAGVDESALNTYVLVLEQLLKVSPFVEPEVKKKALKLANEWKAKMKLSVENSSEIMGFLQFVAAFGLASDFKRDEIFKLLETAAQHQQSRNFHGGIHASTPRSQLRGVINFNTPQTPTVNNPYNQSASASHH